MVDASEIKEKELSGFLQQESTLLWWSYTQLSIKMSLFLVFPICLLCVNLRGPRGHSVFHSVTKCARSYLLSHVRITKPFLLCNVSTSSVHMALSGRPIDFPIFTASCLFLFTQISDSSNLDKVGKYFPLQKFSKLFLPSCLFLQNQN